MAVQYTAIHQSNQRARREARAMISTPARESLNAKLSWQKLMMTLACNFSSSDLVVTLTYRDEARPQTRERADKNLTNFLRAFRTQRTARGQSLVYARVTEGYHSGGNLHHHLIINATNDDYDLIRSLWKKYGDNVDFERFGVDGAERWAKYLTKEPREKGRRYVGDRTWRTSIHMKKPITSNMLVPEDDPLLPPVGSVVTDRAETQNCYGRFSYLMALIPESNARSNSDLG